MNAKPRIGLIAWLVLFLLGAVVPLLLFAGATLFQISKDARAARDQGQADTARALALAVDGEVRSWKAVLTALAESKSLQPGRLAEFYEEARQVAAPHEGWVVLTVVTGDQLLNTLRPYGAPLAKTSSPETIDAIFRDGKPIVSDIIYGRNAQRYLVAVAVPVVRDGKVVNCLTLNFAPRRLSRLLERQQLPPSWVAAINDRQHQVVARSRDIEQREGKPTVAWLAAAEATMDHGILTGPLVDGRPGQVAIERLREVPWHVVLAVPMAELPSSRPLVLFLLWGAVVGVGAVGVALYAGRLITVPVSRLARASEQMLRGETIDLGAPSRIREVGELQQALRGAGAAVQGYYQERERAAVAEEAAKAMAAGAQALRESEERYRTLVETAPDAVMVHREDRILYANSAALRLYGADNLEQLQARSFLSLLIPAEREPVADRVRQVMSGARTPLRETRILRLDGQAVSVEAIAGPVDYSGGRAVQLLMRDITARQREQRERIVTVAFLRLVSESTGTRDLIRAAITFFQEQSGCAAVGVRLWDGDDYPYFEARGFPAEFLRLETSLCVRDAAGQALCDPAGNPLLACMCGKVIGGRVDPVQPFFTAKGSFWANDMTRLLATTTDADRQTTTRNRCGGEGYKSVALVPLHVGAQRLGLLQLNDHRPGRFAPESIALWELLADHLAVAVAKCQAEEALRTAHDVLEQRVQDRTAELSHALQQLSIQATQLRSLASELTMVEQRERLRLAEQIHDGLQQLLVAAKLRVNLLGRGEAPTVRQSCQEISQILEDAVADARTLTAELSPPILRTGGLLAGLEWLARWSAEKHHLTVQVLAPPTPLPSLPEDLTVLLFQSVREILLNAVKYAQVPEATVTLAWDTRGLTLTVADTGAGFNPSGLRGEGGAAGGFGLARIRHHLELLGGRMILTSAPGQGTRVTLLALLPPAATPALLQSTSFPQPTRAPALGSPRTIRILLVDDHQVVRQALAQLLRAEADLEVVGEAGTGTAAVTLAHQLAPEVVLMDINLPEMDGIEATRLIHAELPGVRVIGLSMFDSGDQQAAMQAAGAVAYVSKTGPAEALLAAIRAGGGSV